jgi:hypothetical protein
MQYALLAYGSHRADEGIDPATRAILDRPPVTGWVRLHQDESATTVAGRDERLLITDGPFIDSKEYLAGIILVEADNLDGALAVAREFQQVRGGGAIEVRPVLGSTLGGA